MRRLTLALFVIVALASAHSQQKYNLRQRANDNDFPLSASAQPQLWGEKVNLDAAAMGDKIEGMNRDFIQLRRDVDKQSVIVSMVTFTAQTAGVVFLTFLLTTLMQVGRTQYRKPRSPPSK